MEKAVCSLSFGFFGFQIFSFIFKIQNSNLRPVFPFLKLLHRIPKVLSPRAHNDFNLDDIVSVFRYVAWHLPVAAGRKYLYGKIHILVWTHFVKSIFISPKKSIKSSREKNLAIQPILYCKQGKCKQSTVIFSLVLILVPLSPHT